MKGKGSAPTYNLTPVGYLIVQEAECARSTNSDRNTFGPYYGVDRLPYFIAPDPAIRQALGEPLVEDARLREALEEWFDTQLAATAFIASRQEASRLLKVFQWFGYDLELVYCELAWKAGGEARMKAYAPVEEGRPPICVKYGLDVSWPSCNHSAIVQPGVVPQNASWRSKLNEYGLLEDYSEAISLRDEYLGVYPYPPFDIYYVYKPEKGHCVP